METEIEAKFTQIDPTEIRQRLADVGAKLIQPERLMKRKIFDYPDGRLQTIKGWVRLRDEGDKITLAYKQLNDRTLHGTQEISIIVDDFDRTAAWLEAVGLRQKSYQETKRESWLLGKTTVEIDTWPWIPSYVEIEGESESDVKKTSALLHFDWSQAKHGSVEIVYQEIYDVTEEEIDDWQEATFTPVPDWLEVKRRG